MANRIVRAFAVERMPTHDQRVVLVGRTLERHRAAPGEPNRAKAVDARVEEKVGLLRRAPAALAARPAQHEDELIVRVAKVLERVELREVVGERVKLAQVDMAARPNKGRRLPEDKVPSYWSCCSESGALAPPWPAEEALVEEQYQPLHPLVNDAGYGGLAGVSWRRRSQRRSRRR